MTIIDFIKKYNFTKTFFLGELSEYQLEEFLKCSDFFSTRVNVISHVDSFYVSNTIDFVSVPLGPGIQFNNRINLVGVRITRFPVTDTAQLPLGISQYKYNNSDEICIVFKYDPKKVLKEKGFISEAEVQTHIANTVASYVNFQSGETQDFNNNLENYRYQYAIHLILHKDSVLNTVGKSAYIPVTEVTDDMKLFKNV